MSKRVAFIALACLAVVFAVLGGRSEEGFLSNLWSQLFWLAVGTLATTFVLQAILQHADRVRRRSADAFAFRSFSAHMMNALHEMVGRGPEKEGLFEAALSGDKPFQAAAADAASAIEQSAGFEPGTYLKHYLDVASGLRDLSRSYIRLFSANRKEMLEHYRELNELATHWDFKDEFSERSREYAAALKPDHPDRVARDASLQRRLSSARSLVVRTAGQLAKLASKNATGKSTYADG